MSQPDLTQTSTDGLYRILDLTASPTADWSDEELAAVLDCQLSTPLADDLPAVTGIDAQAVRHAAQGIEPPIETFGQLFLHPTASLEVLDWVKSFAKRLREHPDEPLPQPVVMVLYYLALSTALIRHNQRLTSLKDETFANGLRWALGQAWIDASNRQILQDAFDNLDGGVDQT